MKITYAHQLSQTEANKRIMNLLNALKSSFNDQVSDFNYTWNENQTKLDFSFTIRGQFISGEVACGPGRIVFEAQLPLTVRFFQSQIENMVREKIQAALQ